MRGGRSYGDGGSVVGCQREVKGYGGHGESPVHLHWSGCHTSETLRDKEVWRKRDRMDGKGEGGEQVIESARSLERRRDQMNKS